MPLDFNERFANIKRLTPPALIPHGGVLVYNDRMSDKGERIFAAVDGSNFYHRLREPEVALSNLLDFDFARFAELLAGGRTIVRSVYYIGVVRARADDPMAQELRKNQQRLFSRLRSTRWEIERGYIMRADGFYEKGVDVKIAVDMLSGAYENSYDTVVLVSSDTDLVPAVRKVRGLGKRVEYIGFSHKPSFAMQKHCGFTRLLTRDDLARFVQTK